MNEIIFLIIIISVFTYIMLSFHLGRRWLYVAIALNLMMIGIFGAKLTPVLGLVTNAGNIFYAGVFLIGQLLVEHFGLKEGKQSIWIGLVASAFFLIMGQYIVSLNTVPESQGASEILRLLFEFSPRVAFASLLAYLFSQSFNIHLYSYLYDKSREKIWFRSLAAIILGQFLDSLVFFTFAFWGVVSIQTLIVSAGTGFMVKVLIGALSIPLIYLSFKIKSGYELLAEENEAILDNIGEGVIVTDRNGIILVVNRMFESLMGYRATEVIGRQMTDVVKREDSSGNSVSYQNRILTKVLSGKRIASTATNHTFFLRKDGRKFPVKITVTPIRIDHKIIGAVELFINVTAEQQLEQTRVDFLSLASHQLRTPLSGTRWTIETLKKGIAGNLNAKQIKYLDHIYEVNNQLIKLANETLSILRLDSGVVPLNKEKFAVSRLFAELKKELEIKAGQKKIVLAFSPKSANITVNSDYSIVRNIVLSFLENAINYSDSGKIVVIEAVESPLNIIIAVKDNGIGIPEDENAKIFERFYRASNAKLIIPDGTGLGLAISKMLSDKIGAKISFTSGENKGTSFSLIIPKKV